MNTTTPLRDRPSIVDHVNHLSNTLFINGIPNHVTDDELTNLLCALYKPIEMDLSRRKKTGINAVWTAYCSIMEAKQTFLFLNGCRCLNVRNAADTTTQSTTNNTNSLSSLVAGSGRSNISIIVKFELGLDPVSGKRFLCRFGHNTRIREVREICDRAKTKKNSARRKQQQDGQVHKESLDNHDNFITSPIKQNSKNKARELRPAGGNVHNISDDTNTNSSKNKGLSTLGVSSYSYTSSSITVNDTDFPFPTGLYLTRLTHLAVQTLKNSKTTVGLLSLLLDKSFYGKKYTKEVTEAFAMIDAVERAVKMILCRSLENLVVQEIPVHVHCVGDGAKPLTAAALCLYIQQLFIKVKSNEKNGSQGSKLQWKFYSIDPILEPIDIFSEDKDDAEVKRRGFQYKDVFFQHPICSEDFEMPPFASLLPLQSACCPFEKFASISDMASESSSNLQVSVVIACHSHAPLQEFWNRMNANPNISSNHENHVCLGIVMECCADYNNLETVLLDTTCTSSLDLKNEEKKIHASNGLANTVCSTGKGENVNIPAYLGLNFDDFEVYSPKRNIKIYCNKTAMLHL